MKLLFTLLFFFVQCQKLAFAYSNYVYMPWRHEYESSQLKPVINNCALCDTCAGDAQENLILSRTQYFFITLNRFPYTKGHILIIPHAHVPDLSYLKVEALHELIELAHECTSLLNNAFNCNGFNIGVNIGKAAGASIAAHLHFHVVPRYDSVIHSFMQSIGDAVELPWSLKKIYQELKPAFARLEVK